MQVSSRASAPPRARRLAALATAWAVLFCGCHDHATAPPSESGTQIVSGVENPWTGGGREVRVLPSVVQHDTWARYDAPHTTQTAPLDGPTWNALLDAIDSAALTALPEIVGCPGCADGTIEWLEVRRGTFHKRVRFSPWDDLGAGNTALLEQVRALRGD